MNHHDPDHPIDSVRPATTSPPPQLREPQPGVERQRSLAILAVCACAIGMGVGYQFGKSEGARVSAVEAAAQAETVAQQVAARAARTADLEQELAARARKLALLHARHLVHESIVHLHGRNFGLAADSAHAAGAALEKLTADNEDYAELAEQLRVVSLDVNPDIHDQVMLLAELAASLDDMM